MTAVSTAHSAMGRLSSCAVAKVTTAAVVLRTHSRSSGPWLALHVRSRLQPVANGLMPSSSVTTSACAPRARSAAPYDNSCRAPFPQCAAARQPSASIVGSRAWDPHVEVAPCIVKNNPETMKSMAVFLARHNRQYFSCKAIMAFAGRATVHGSPYSWDAQTSVDRAAAASAFGGEMGTKGSGVRHGLWWRRLAG